MIRKIIHIDEEKCNGCGLCANACHEGALAVVDGKARLLRDDFCDGFGDCLPECPTGAISFVEREADAYDEEAVEKNKQRMAALGIARGQHKGRTPVQAPVHGPAQGQAPHPGSCPGSNSRTIVRDRPTSPSAKAPAAMDTVGSQLTNWPVQIKLAPTKAPYFDGAHLLIAADCCAYAYGNFHQEFIRNKTCLIGCSKLDGVDYTEKLTAIIRDNDVRSVTITRMEVPCCGGLEHFATEALKASGKFIPWQVVTFSIEGEILD